MLTSVDIDQEAQKGKEELLVHLVHEKLSKLRQDSGIISLFFDK